MDDPKYKPALWRLIISRPASGAYNMAIDEALLQSVGAGGSPPVLRLYSWIPPCLSLGYAQPFSDVDPDKTTKLGWDIVRRMTGGRAILHTDELTYAVIAPNTEPRLKGGILESYMRLSQALLKAVLDLGIPAQASVQTQDFSGNTKPKNPVCFSVPSKYEITCQGKKLLGSAQARKKEGILQHGSLPLKGDLTRILKILKPGNETEDPQYTLNTRSAMLSKATTMENILGRAPNWEEAASTFVKAFEDTLGIAFTQGQPSAEETNLAHELVKEKYANPTWTMRI